MRQKTRIELTKLAEVIVDKFHIDKILGSNEFLEIALDEAEKEDIEVNWQTIKSNEEWLKNKCVVLNKEGGFTDEGLDKFIEEIYEKEPKRELKTTIHLYSDGTFEVVKHKKEEVVDLSKVPQYTMFIESEDGYLVTRGAYKGKYVHDIDKDSWVGCAAGWANKILIDNERLGLTRPGALTDDDKVVLEKVKTNKI